MSPLEHMARRVANDPFFLGAILHCYAESEQLTPAALANYLGCSVETLPQVQLCRAPRAEAGAFTHDIELIANRFHLDTERLMEVVRHGQALQRLRAASSAAAGSLLAARDRPPPPDSPPGETP